MWKWTITPTLSLTNVLRVDYLVLGRNGFLPADYPFTNADWNRTNIQPSFNSGVVWRPRESDSVRLMLSRGVQLPSLVASGALLLDAPSEKLTGSPLINPSVVTNYEIGWEHALSGHHLLFRANAFDQDSFDVMAPRGAEVPSPGGPYTTPTNIGDSHAFGLEFELKGALPSNFRWGVHDRPEWIFDHFIPSAQDGGAYVAYDDTTPFHLLKANLGWANAGWELDGYLQYHAAVSGTVPLAAGGTTDVPIGAFVAMDGRVAYKYRDRITWSVSGQNLTHASQVQTSGPAVERRVLGTMTFNF
jgi:iron complex outermembrane receptor protein